MSLQLKQELENFYLTEPYRISDYWSNYLLGPTAWTPKEKLAELESMLRSFEVCRAVPDVPHIAVTVEELQAHIEQLLSRVYIESLATGNLREEVCRNIAHVE